MLLLREDLGQKAEEPLIVLTAKAKQAVQERRQRRRGAEEADMAGRMK